MKSNSATILFTRFWWKRLYQKSQKTKNFRMKKNIRQEMRQVACNLLEFLLEES